EGRPELAGSRDIRISIPAGVGLLSGRHSDLSVLPGWGSGGGPRRPAAATDSLAGHPVVLRFPAGVPVCDWRGADLAYSDAFVCLRDGAGIRRARVPGAIPCAGGP